MKYITFKTNSKYPEVNKWFDDRLFGEAQSVKEWLTCWVRKSQGLCGREKMGDKTYWVFIFKDRENFIRNLVN